MYLSGYITSPLYPNKYAHARECLWSIKAEPGMRIKLTFEDLDLPEDEMPDCRFDRITVSVSTKLVHDIWQRISS